MRESSLSTNSHRLLSLPILLSLLILPAVESARADEAGQAFTKSCGECHGNRAIRAWLKKEPDNAKRKAWLDGFLTKHYPPPANARALIIQHIASQKK